MGTSRKKKSITFRGDFLFFFCIFFFFFFSLAISLKMKVQHMGITLIGLLIIGSGASCIQDYDQCFENSNCCGAGYRCVQIQNSFIKKCLSPWILDECAAPGLPCETDADCCERTYCHTISARRSIHRCKEGRREGGGKA